MLIVRVELLSAITGQRHELARLEIINDGTGTHARGNYEVHTFKGRSERELNRRLPQRKAEVRNYPRLTKHVWHLVARALAALDYR